jgi:CIC family chloride channel protein
MPATVRSERARRRRLILDTLLLGAAGALAAQVFTVLLLMANRLFLHGMGGYRPPGLPSEGGLPNEAMGAHGVLLVPLVMAIGGLVVGILTVRFAPEAEGHGTDAVVKAFHRADGALRGRVAPIKLLASAITIGSGGSAGREGPIALVGASVGSWYATITQRKGRERRLLLLIGMAAGLSAVFRSPIGTAIMAIEVLYADMEFEAGPLLYTMLAAIVAYALNGFFAGWEPLFRVPVDFGRLPRVIDNAWYIVLGLAAGTVAVLMPPVFYGVRDMFRRLPAPKYVKPAIGALLTGLIALALPQVIGGGYGWVQQAIDGRLTPGVLFTLVAAKWIATSLTVGSGGSGGVFAPSLYVGAMLGGACAALVHLPPAPFVIVGMAAVFAGAARVPIATLMMVTEMTSGYTLLVPAALSVLISYLVQSRLSEHFKHRSLYEAQVAGRADSPAHHTQHLTTALRLLRERQPQDLTNVGEVDLVSLLRSGVPVELAAGRSLVVGILRDESPYVGTTVGSSGRQLDGGSSNIIAILRGEHMVVPSASTVLQQGDRLVLVTSAEGIARLEQNIAPW